MLVLSRKRAESIRIGEDIEITIASIRGGNVRLAIAAPRCVPVWRSEIGTGIDATNKLVVSRNRTPK